LREGVSGVFFEDEVMLEAQQRGIEANPGYDFYNLNIDAGSMWTRRVVARMIAAEQGTDTGTDDEHSGAAAAALSAVTSAENARVDSGKGGGTGNGHSAGTGMEAEVTEGVAKHRDRPEAGLMARGI
jgi:vanillate O-demethylase monooxygenase subunit